MKPSMKSQMIDEDMQLAESEEKKASALKEEYENLLRQFLFLNELVSLLFSSAKVEEMLNKIVTGVHRMLNIDRVAVLCMSDDNEKVLECIHAAGLEKDVQNRLKIKIDECKEIILHSAVSKSPFLSREDVAALKRSIYGALSEQESDSLIFPLFSYRGAGCLQNRSENLFYDSDARDAQKRHTASEENFSIGEECIDCKYFPFLGMIWMDNKQSGRRINHELVTLYTLILNMNIAIENKILIRQLRDVSIKDGLTGAFNRNYLFSIIEKEVERASRQENHLSVAMIDLDNFKNINDTYGHQFGDKFLQGFSQFMQKNTRKMDYFCRYGGDEFVVVFPGATAEQASNVVRRLAEKMKREGKDLVNMQISTGIASYPDSTQNAQKILEFADRALYDAKRKGKGIIEIFTLT